MSCRSSCSCCSSSSSSCSRSSSSSSSSSCSSCSSCSCCCCSRHRHTSWKGDTCSSSVGKRFAFHKKSDLSQLSHQLIRGTNIKFLSIGGEGKDGLALKEQKLFSGNAIGVLDDHFVTIAAVIVSTQLKCGH